MFPEAYFCIVDANEGGALRCYYDNTFGLFETGISTACDYITAIEQPNLEESVKVYPNPATSSITIEFKTLLNNQYHINLYSILNKRIINYKTQNELTKIEIGKLSDGVYLIEITNGYNNSWTKQIIKNAPNKQGLNAWMRGTPCGLARCCTEPPTCGAPAARQHHFRLHLSPAPNPTLYDLCISHPPTNYLTHVHHHFRHRIFV